MLEPADESLPVSFFGDRLEFERLIRLGVEASPNGILVVAEDGAIAWANRAIVEMFGYSRAELSGQPVEMLLPADLAAAHGRHIENFQKNPQRRKLGEGGELVARRKDGSTVPVEITLNPVWTETGLFIISNVIDITDRRALQEGLRSSLTERLAFEAAIADIAAGLVSLSLESVESVDAALTDSLRRVVEALDLDRAVLFVAEGDDFVPLYRWVRPGLQQPAGTSVSVKLQFPWFFQQAHRGEIVRYQRVDDIPDEASRKSVQRFGAKSGVMIGFDIDGRLGGLISFASLRAERAWPEDVVSRLKMVTGVLAGAIARKRTDEALAAALSQIKQLSDQVEAENVYLRHEVRQSVASTPVVGHSAALAAVLEQVQQVAATDSNVLLLGETGSGKELIATQVHESSPRRERLMVRVNCAAIPSALIESELFGREKGAYTGALTRQIGRFELADRSSIFLDEIGDLPLDVQVKLLRVLEDHSVERLGGSGPIKINVRVIAATHRDLEDMVAKGTFREDLYYRLNVFPIRVPPLRERPDDIPILVWRFVEEFSKRFGKPIDGVTKDSMTALQRYSWPGNVRELRNVVERAMIVTNSGRLTIRLPQSAAAAAEAPVGPGGKLLDVEAAHILGVLETVGWRVRGKDGAAERLGLKPSTLETRMAKLGIRRPKPA